MYELNISLILKEGAGKNRFSSYWNTVDPVLSGE